MTAVTTDSVGSKGTVKIMANIFISFLGAGILGLPYAFMEAGILEGIAIMLFVGICSVKAMLLVIDCKHRLIAKTPRRPASNGTSKSERGNKSEKEDLLDDGETAIKIEDPTMPAAPGQNLTYGDVGYYAIGNLGRVIVDVVIVVSQVGFCCAYLIFICENLADFFGHRKIIHWLCLLLPPLFGLTLLRHLSSLALSSLFAQLSNLMAFGVVFWFDFEHFSQVDIHPREISLEGFPFFLAIAIYCYEGAGMILSLEASLHKDVRHQFKGYFKLTMAVVTFLYISFGVCGYLSFGPETNAIITLNLPKGSSLDFSMVVKSCLCLALFFTYPVMMFPVINIIETKLIHNAQENHKKGNILRFFMVFLTGLVVLAVPNFANMMALVGATCCTMIAFILPAVFHMKLFKGDLTKSQFALDAFLIVLGIAGTIVGTMDALVRLRETHTAKPTEGLTTVAQYYNATHVSIANLPILGNTSATPIEKWIATNPTQLPVISNKAPKQSDPTHLPGISNNTVQQSQQTNPAKVPVTSKNIPQYTNPAQSPGMSNNIPQHTNPVQSPGMSNNIPQQTNPAPSPGISNNIPQHTNPVQSPGMSNNIPQRTNPTQSPGMSNNIPQRTSPAQSPGMSNNIPQRTSPAPSLGISKNTPQQLRIEGTAQVESDKTETKDVQNPPRRAGVLKDSKPVHNDAIHTTIPSTSSPSLPDRRENSKQQKRKRNSGH